MEQNTEKKGLFARLKEGLGKTRDSFNEKLDNVFSVRKYTLFLCMMQMLEGLMTISLQ